MTQDIYVSTDEELMIIDPKKAYKRKVDYPRHLMKGMKRIGILEDFLLGISEIDREKAVIWEEKFQEYIENI